MEIPEVVEVPMSVAVGLSTVWVANWAQRARDGDPPSEAEMRDILGSLLPAEWVDNDNPAFGSLMGELPDIMDALADPDRLGKKR